MTHFLGKTVRWFLYEISNKWCESDASRPSFATNSCQSLLNSFYSLSSVVISVSLPSKYILYKIVLSSIRKTSCISFYYYQLYFIQQFFVLLLRTHLSILCEFHRNLISGNHANYKTVVGSPSPCIRECWTFSSPQPAHNHTSPAFLWAQQVLTQGHHCRADTGAW